MEKPDAAASASALLPADQRPRLGLALSGGGVRAAVFHLGLLRRLAEDGRLEDVSAVSTVSGGSLVTAAIMTRAPGGWPSSSRFLADTYPAIRLMMTSADLFSPRALGWRGAIRHGAAVLTNRAGLLARMLEERWKVEGHLGDLPDVPTWSINTTCIETGKNWRFSKREMGDWVFGRHYAPPFKIAQAAAASAAVPYGIGALRLELPAQGWKRTDPASREPIGDTQPPAVSVRLWDGGAYENLGLEALYKPGEALRGCNFLICSDASGPLRPLASPLATIVKGNLWSPRLFDIASDQIRSLRSRMLMRDIVAGKIEGVLVRMGKSARNIDITAGTLRPPAEYDGFLSDEVTQLALRYPTNLKALTPDAFDRLSRHGYEAADLTLARHDGARVR